MNEKTIEKDNETYRKIDDIGDYIKKTAEVNACMGAKKNGYITVRRAEPGEKIAVFTSDGHEEAQETAKKGDWIATRSYESGTPYVNENGSQNSWLMSNETLEKKYEIERDSDGEAMRNSSGEIMCSPKGEKQAFMRVSENVVISVPWGENGAPVNQYIKEGGWLNITDRNDVYGIAEQEFFDTYDRTYTYNGQRSASGEYTEYDAKVEEAICMDTWKKTLDRMRSLGIEFSSPEYKKDSLSGYGDGSVELRNGIRVHIDCHLSGEGEIFSCEKDGFMKRINREPVTEENISMIESMKTMPYRQYFENMVSTYFPEKADDLMTALDSIEFPQGAEKPVFYHNEPDYETATIAVDTLEKTSALIARREEFEQTVDSLPEMPHETQAERVAVLKKAAELYKEKDKMYDEEDSVFDYDDVNKAKEKGMAQPALYIETAVHSVSLGNNDTIHEATNRAINELFKQLSADTQGVTHDEVQKNFDKYAIPGLDSVQYLTDNLSAYYDLVQLTLSDDKYFNADVMRIPAELVDNLPSAMAAAAKYSQTQEEFEKECPDISYEETYHNADEAEYSECSSAFEPLGDARTDDEIGEVMYAAAGNIEKDSYEYEAYMHAVEVLDNAGIEGLKEEVEERYMSDQEWEKNERENEIDAPEYDDLEL